MIKIRQEAPKVSIHHNDEERRAQQDKGLSSWTRTTHARDRAGEEKVANTIKDKDDEGDEGEV